MNFDYSAKTRELQKRLQAFMDENIYPNEKAYQNEINSGSRWQPLNLIEDLKEKAKAENLWNLFLPEISGLTNTEYAPLAEIMGRVYWSAEVFNCSAPDTGNMEVLERYGTDAQKETWLRNPFVFFDDRAGSCFVGRDEYFGFDCARRRRICFKWSQMVVNRRGRCTL
jgi:acyl-CoA dehydrogenase